jgi:hypothetical protein
MLLTKANMLELFLSYTALAVLAASFFITGRESKTTANVSPSVIRLAFSFYSVGIGGWTLSVPAEIGARFGWFGAFGYAFVCTSPLWILMTIGHKLKVDEPCLMSWIQARYGSVVRFVVTMCSLFYMSIFLASELTVVGSFFEPFTHRLCGIIPVATLAFSHGLYRSSSNLQSHGIQGFLCLALVAIGVPLILAMIDVDEGKLKQASKLNQSSLFSVGILCLACATSELLNFAEWQRVWSCENQTTLTKALLLAVVLIFGTLAGLGCVGVLANASTAGLDDPQSAFIVAMSFSGRALRILVTLMGVILATSTSDALAFGISELVKETHRKLSESKLLLVLVVGGLVFTPCVIVAWKNISVLTLFMIANLMTSIVAPPVFCGAVTKVSRVGLMAGLTAATSIVVTFYVTCPSLKEDVYNKHGFLMYLSTVSSGGTIAVLTSRLLK